MKVVKKATIATVAIALVLFMVMPTMAFAAGNRGQCAWTGVQAARAKVPNVGNYIDADGDGVCDYYGIGQGGGRFVDTDGDGICDNYGTGQGDQSYGHGKGHGHGHGQGKGMGNGNGHCRR